MNENSQLIQFTVVVPVSILFRLTFQLNQKYKKKHQKERKKDIYIERSRKDESCST